MRNQIDKKVCRYLRTLSKGKAYDCAAWTQLDQRPAPPQVEVATSARGDGAQSRTLADNGGNMVTTARRSPNIDNKRRLSAHSEPFLGGFLGRLAFVCGVVRYGGFFFDFGRRNTPLWCPFSMMKTSETLSSAQISSSCEQQHSSMKHSGTH